jgi:hypothetical protein
METLFYITGLFLLLLTINILQLKFSKPGSDHYIHFAYINSIRNNKNKFINKVNSFINDDDFPDPQLYHWLLSFLPEHFLIRNYKLLGLFINVSSFFFFIGFIYLLFPFLAPTLSLDFDKFLLYTTIFYIITPFEYFSWNAKNVGLSARGFGLLFGNLFVYALTLYFLSGNIVFLLFSIFFSYIILLSSQFSFQFVFFFTLITSFIFRDIYVFTIPFIATTIFILTFPKWSKIFFARQWEYKKLYYKLFSYKFGLKFRYSIWRDFFYDFWIAIYKRGVLRGIEYIYRNPVIEVIIGFPALTLVTLTYFFKKGNIFNQGFSTIAILILSSLLIFLFTSFRKTRFLGEPQRYIEFVFPLISILPLFFASFYLFVFIIIISLVTITFESFVIKLISRKQGGGVTTVEKTIKLLHCFNSIVNDKEEIRIISNNLEVLKYFADKNFKILNINVTSAYTGGIHFNEIFPDSYGVFSIDVLSNLVQHYKINWFILDQNLISKELLEKQFQLPIKEKCSIYHYTIYKLC